MMCTDAVCIAGSPGSIGWLHLAQWSRIIINCMFIPLYSWSSVIRLYKRGEMRTLLPGPAGRAARERTWGRSPPS